MWTSQVYGHHDKMARTSYPQRIQHPIFVQVKYDNIKCLNHIGKIAVFIYLSDKCIRAKLEISNSPCLFYFL